MLIEVTEDTIEELLEEAGNVRLLGTTLFVDKNPVPLGTVLIVINGVAAVATDEDLDEETDD